MTKYSPRPILVTGASSGIGKALTRSLAGQGHTVYATAREDDDLAELALIDNVTPVFMDVRDPDMIMDALTLIARRGGGLYGLVNNAGIGELGFCSTWNDQDLIDIFDVNVFGPFRLTNACLPLLLESHGRVVNIGSQGGMISKKYYGPYTMTKHAMEAYTVALGEELAPFGVRVSIVQPGGIVSSIGANSMPGTVAKFERAEPPFRQEARAVLESFKQPDPSPDETAGESESNRKPSSPEIVTQAVVEALFSETPKQRYLVGTKWEGDRVIHALLDKLLDENDNPVHNYSRQQLVELLDQKIAERSRR
jgi:NAD(P)-dependent dehydrogenase (short-subunit alcohol dehydrogenase family)